MVGAGAISGLWGPFKAGLDWVTSLFEGLDVEARELSFRDVRDSHHLFVVITPDPIAYTGKFQIANGTSRRLGIKKAELITGGRSFWWREEEVEAFAPGDVRVLDLVFPAVAGSPKAGPFEVRLTDSTGRVRSVRGHLS